MAFWLLKTEPGTWSWDDQVARGASGEPWTGVRNYQARNHMRAMTVGDRCFFYHSVDERQIVGIIEVIAPVAPDPTDATGAWECVTVRAAATLPSPVTLDRARSDPRLADMVLVRNARLSVQPVRPAEWEAVLDLARKG